MSGLRRGLKNIRLVSGKTYTEVELPEAAALVYPDLDRAVEDGLQQGLSGGGGKGKGKGKGPEKETVKDKFKGAGEWVQDYMDRKAQAAYVRVSLHPNSTSIDCAHHWPHLSLLYSPPKPTLTKTPFTGTRPPRLLARRPSRRPQGLQLALQRPEPPRQQRVPPLPRHGRRRRHGPAATCAARRQAGAPVVEARAQGRAEGVPRQGAAGSEQAVLEASSWARRAEEEEEGRCDQEACHAGRAVPPGRQPPDGGGGAAVGGGAGEDDGPGCRAGLGPD